jgi:hypothetical protein
MSVRIEPRGQRRLIVEENMSEYRSVIVVMPTTLASENKAEIALTVKRIVATWEKSAPEIGPLQ